MVDIENLVYWLDESGVVGSGHAHHHNQGNPRVVVIRSPNTLHTASAISLQVFESTPITVLSY